MRSFGIVVALAACSKSPAPASVEVTSWGSLREMMHEGRVESRVAIAPLLARPHLYALGAVEGMRGEITILDGVPWLSLGARERGRATSRVTDEGAALLVATSVEHWQRITLTENIESAEVDARIEALARAAGLDVESPVPFLVEGELADVQWHILVKPPDTPGAHDHTRNAVHGEAAAMHGTAVGFFSKHHAGVFTHMGEHTHVHVVDPTTALAAHADRWAARAGSVVSLPSR